MMGYIFLIFALFAGATKGYCGKKTSGYVAKTRDAFFINMTRMLLCLLISFVLITVSGEIQDLKVGHGVLVLSVISGITTSVFVILWIFSVQKGAYMMVDVFLMLGCIIPIVSSTILFDEKIEVKHIVGIVILVVSAFIMCSYNNSIKSKMTLTSLVILVLCAMANGGTSLTQKMFATRYPDASVAVFNFYTYLFSGLVLVVCYVIYSWKEQEKQKVEKSIFGYIVIMAICLFAHSYFMTFAAKHLAAVILYPFNQGMAMVLSALMAAMFFKEKISSKCILGMVLAFLGLLVINVL